MNSRFGSSLVAISSRAGAWRGRLHVRSIDEAATDAAAWAVPLVEMLPLGESVFELWIPQIDSWPELLESGSLYPFDFSVETGCARLDRLKLDAPLAKALLDPIGKELLAVVCLEA